jgi:hypothetical protein
MPPRYLIYWAILLLTCGYTLARGRKYERIAAGVFLTATIVTVIDHVLLHIRYQSVDLGEVFVDFAVLISGRRDRPLVRPLLASLGSRASAGRQHGAYPQSNHR